MRVDKIIMEALPVNKKYSEVKKNNEKRYCRICGKEIKDKRSDLVTCSRKCSLKNKDLQSNSWTKKHNLEHRKELLNPVVLLILGIFCLSFINATITWDTTRQNNCTTLDQSCPTCTYVNITMINYPNGTSIFPNDGMTKSGSKFYYSYCPEQLGTYHLTLQGDKDGAIHTEEGYLSVTPTGSDFGITQGITAVGILFGILILAGIFLYIGVKMFENDSMIPIAFFFIVLSIILCIYSLHLGWVYSVNILQFGEISNTSEVIYIAFLWLIAAVGVISMILMAFSLIKELGRRKDMRSFGEGYNPITKTYDF